MLFLFVGLALSIFVIAAAVLALLIRSGQLDDLDTPPLRLLADERPADPPHPAGGSSPTGSAP
jgi:nitrogen fixation-related uncharacterized protein